MHYKQSQRHPDTDMSLWLSPPTAPDISQTQFKYHLLGLLHCRMGSLFDSEELSLKELVEFEMNQEQSHDAMV